jgi:urease accessory protein
LTDAHVFFTATPFSSMLVIERRAPGAAQAQVRLILPFDLRQRSRLRTRAENGEEVGLFLERGAQLRDGDLLLADDGRVVEVVAAAEAVYRVMCADGQLARLAYHLGNRHVPVQIGAGWLRIARDHVLKEMLEKLGASVSEETAPFQPEGGAYASHGHAHA